MIQHLVFLFILFFWGVVSAQANTLQGFIFVSNNNHYITDSLTHKSYLVSPSNNVAAEGLSKLKSFDTMTGTGMIEGQVFILDSVDFVALRRLIGIWRAPQTVVNFMDYSRVNFRVPAGQNSQYQYALSPGPGDTWRIFLTDKSSVVLGTLLIDNSHAQIEVFHPKTGEVSQKFELEKLNF
jgi:hypothetical protein